MNKLSGKKIFFAISSTSEFANQWQYYHFIEELGHYDIGFEIFNINNYEIKQYQEVLIKQIKSKRNNVSLFITALQDHQISSDAIETIKSLGIPTLLICYDNLIIPFKHKNICKHFDLVWLTSHETEPFFHNWGAKTIFLPYAANPFKFFPSYSNELACVGFIGSLYGSRKFKIKILDENNIYTIVYSNQNNNPQNIQTKQGRTLVAKLKSFKQEIIDFSHLMSFDEGRTILNGNFKKAIKKRFQTEPSFNPNTHFFDSPSFEDMNRLYSEFALSLGIIDTWNTYLLKKPLFKIHLRTFEIPMCGGLQITNRTTEIMNYFEEDKEIIFYDSKSEMINKIKFYLEDKNAGLRLKMKKAARLRSEKDHTWYHRFNKIVQIIYS